ncbi:MAG: putative muramoyltetrapeptide carboxypeptidase [Gemmatimonadetes bacterium]|nr:putative muramoyltetrapeptide carboxypeptidase [Gemmatimonadota bacterium]
MIRPPALAPGARVALVAAAGPLADEAVDRAIARVREWGWEPVVGTHARERTGFLAGDDDGRAADLNAALRDPRVDGVWLLRGGYGTPRIVHRIDWDALAARPCAVIGFSDNTALHLAAQQKRVVTFHGPHPATVEFSAFSADSLRRSVTRAEPAGLLPFPATHPGRADTLVAGSAEGRLVGGNLSLLASLAGTPYTLDARGAILFVEEVGEPAYRVDRMLTQLILSGALDGVAGIAVGAFSETVDADRPDLPSAAEVVRERLGPLGVPIAFGFPFGHIDETWTLPEGVPARLDADAGTLEVLEPAVE